MSEEGPIRSFLRKWQPILPRPKLIDMLSGLTGQVALPPGVTPEQAIEVVAKSEWARRLAEGVCGPGYAGFTPGTEEFERCVYNVSHRVAARVLGLEYIPPPAPARPRRR
ncbi:MAG: hypothetical protein QXN21_04475 [Candidatus Bathyarchaeia archaeon]